MSHDVFISYATADKLKAFAACHELEQAGIRCWIAPRDILPGSPWTASIMDAIGHAKIMVLVFSNNANLSTHVLNEVERAVSKGYFVIPLRVEDVAPSGGFELLLSNTHWLDAFPEMGRPHFEQLVGIVNKLLGREPADAVERPVITPLAEVEPPQPRIVEPPVAEPPVMVPPRQQAGPAADQGRYFVPQTAKTPQKGMGAGVIVAIVFGALVLICGGVGLIGAIVNQSHGSSSSSTSGGDFGLSTSTGSTGSSTQNIPLSDPKEQALKIMNVFHNEDWRGMFSLIAVSANNKSSLQDPDAFAQGMSNGLNSGGQDSAVVHELFRSMQNIRVEEPFVSGDKASVPCSCTVTISGTTKDFAGVVNLTLDNGEWKWDLTGSDDLQAESAKQTKALLGTPK